MLSQQATFPILLVACRNRQRDVLSTVKVVQEQVSVRLQMPRHRVHLHIPWFMKSSSTIFAAETARTCAQDARRLLAQQRWLLRADMGYASPRLAILHNAARTFETFAHLILLDADLVHVLITNEAQWYICVEAVYV